MKDISILIPTLNEKDNIHPLLERIEQNFQHLDTNIEILFIDDGSTDGTRCEIEHYKGSLDVRLIYRETEKGLSTAVLAGAALAESEIIVVMDADLSHPPEKIIQLAKPIISGHHDMVVGSRYTKNGNISQWPITRKLSSQIASLPARFLTGIKDPLSGFFAVRKKTLLRVNPNIQGYKIGLEILGRESLSVLEIPIDFKDRSAGNSKMSSKVVIEYLKQLLSLYGYDKSFSDIILFFAFPLSAAAMDFTLYSSLINSGIDFVASHLASYLLTMIIFTLFFQLIKRKKHNFVNNMPLLPYMTILLCGVFLRGGVFAFSVSNWGTRSIPTLLVLSSITLITTFIVCALIYRKTPPTSTTFLNSTTKPFIISVIVYTLALRFFYLGIPELIQEEAYYWNYAQHMAGGYLDHPPGVAILIWVGTVIFGTNEFGVRIGAFLCWFLTAGFTYKFVSSIFDTNVALRSTLLIATLPVFFGVGLIMTPDAPLIASWAATLFFLHEAMIKNKSKAWLSAGIAIGIGLSSKYTIAFLAPAIVVLMIIDSRSRKLFFKPHPYLAAAIALIIFSPVIWWNYNNDWASFLFQSQRRILKATEFSTHELLASILVLLTPTGFIAIFSSMKAAPWRKKKSTGADNSLSRSYLFCAVMTTIPLSIFILFSLTKEIKLNWTGPLWLALMPFISYHMVFPCGKINSFISRLWKPTIITSMLIYGAVLHYFSIGLPGIPFAKEPVMAGWDELAHQVEKVVQAVFVEEGQRPLVVGMGKYKIASGMAFYRYKNLTAGAEEDYKQNVIDETTGSHLFGYNAIMYRYWHKPEKLSSSSVIIIAKNQKSLSPAYFKNHFKKLGPVMALRNEKNGHFVGTYYYRLAKGYSAMNNEVASVTQTP